MSAEVANIALNAFPSQRPPRTKRGGKKVQYKKLKDALLIERPICEVCRFEKSITVHHRHGRVGKLLLWKPGLVAICEKCHQTVHAAPEWAIANGWIKIPWNHFPVDAIPTNP